VVAIEQRLAHNRDLARDPDRHDDSYRVRQHDPSRLRSWRRAGRERVQLTFGNGAVVGANNPSVDLQTMLESYDNCLEAMSQQLFAYAKFADLLTSAAHTIAGRYTTTDQLSGASALAVQAAFNKADTGSDAPLIDPNTGMAL
jgi:hypothetical protein